MHITNFLHAVLAVELRADLFVCLDKLVYLLGEFVVLVAHNSNVVVHRVNFRSQIVVASYQLLCQSTRRVQIFAKVHNLVFFLADLGFHISNATASFDASAALVVDTTL